MKKLFTVITLLMSSFFLFSINEVKAETYTFNLADNSLDIINDDFFTFKDKVIKYSETNNYEKYIILYYSHIDSYRVIFLNDNPNVYMYSQLVSEELRLRYSLSNYSEFNLDSSGNMVHVYTGSGVNNLVSDTYNSLAYYVDSNFDLLSYDLVNKVEYFESDTYYINYGNLSYTLTQGVPCPTLYQIYLDSTAEPVDPYKEDKEMINNFYSTIFTKIGDLATSFASNYIFLLIFGIFILIFVFELIRRRLL